MSFRKVISGIWRISSPLALTCDAFFRALDFHFLLLRRAGYAVQPRYLLSYRQLFVTRSESYPVNKDFQITTGRNVHPLLGGSTTDQQLIMGHSDKTVTSPSCGPCGHSTSETPIWAFDPCAHI